MSVRTVLFDLGGVVCRFDRPPRLAALAALDPTRRLTPALVQERIWTSGISERADRGELTEPALLDAVRAALGIDARDGAIRAAWVQAFTPDRDVLALVDAVRARVTTGLLTDNPALLRTALEERYPDLLPRFQPALFSCEFGALKPSAELFQRVLARLGEPPAAVLLLDDSVTNVEGARAVGMQAVRFLDAGQATRELAAQISQL